MKFCRGKTSVVALCTATMHAGFSEVSMRPQQSELLNGETLSGFISLY